LILLDNPKIAFAILLCGSFLELALLLVAHHSLLPFDRHMRLPAEAAHPLAGCELCSNLGVFGHVQKAEMFQ
jgi:hypothetical protein